MTREGPDVTLAEEKTQIPSVSPHDTLANNLANSGVGARAEDDATVAMEGQIMSQGEEGEQNRMTGGVQDSTPQGRAKHQGRCHLAAPSRGPAHPGALRAADHTDLDLKKFTL